MSFFRLLLIGMCCALLSVDADEHAYRVYDETTSERVRQFYKTNHEYQTLAFVLSKKKEYLPPRRLEMDIWQAMSLLDTIVDESDPDLDLAQSYHCYQTAEAMRKDGLPRWLIAIGFIHDLGKMLCLYDEPQWAVVGDTFPVGCRFSPKITFPEYLTLNPDFYNPLYMTTLGIYSEGCGWNNVHFSWGHDEYLYHVVKDNLPKEASYIIRYHSFYAGHSEGEYTYLMNEEDKQLLPWVKKFQQYDLYSKDPEPLDIEALKPYYMELIAEFFPDPLWW